MLTPHDPEPRNGMLVLTLVPSLLLRVVLLLPSGFLYGHWECTWRGGGSALP